MGIFSGHKETNNIMIGNKKIKQVYVGNKLVYDNKRKYIIKNGIWKPDEDIDTGLVPRDISQGASIPMVSLGDNKYVSVSQENGYVSFDFDRYTTPNSGVSIPTLYGFTFQLNTSKYIPSSELKLNFHVEMDSYLYYSGNSGTFWKYFNTYNYSQSEYPHFNRLLGDQVKWEYDLVLDYKNQPSSAINLVYIQNQYRPLTLEYHQHIRSLYIELVK